MSITKDFNNEQWYEKLLGDGTVVVGDSGASITCTASAGSAAYRRHYMVVRPGEKFTIKVWARNKPEAGKTGFACMFIDAPIGTLRNEINITSNEPRLYTLQFEAPQQLTGPTKIAFGLGAYTSTDGSAEFWAPEFYRAGSNIVMQGTLKFPDGGGVELATGFINSGVGNISWRAIDMGFRIEPKEIFSFDETTGVNQFRPIATVSGGLEGNATEPYVWYISQVNNVGWCTIQAVSLTTGEPVNLNASTNLDRYATFKLEMAS